MRKTLTYGDQLFNFCQEHSLLNFKSTSKEDYLVVSIPANFEANRIFEDSSDDRFMNIHLEACHTLENLNGSFISEDDMNKALPSFHNCPILASIVKKADDTYDFNGHDMEIIDDPFNEGEKRVNYIERCVGVIPADSQITLEKDQKTDKQFVHADGIIYTEHGNLAAEILKNRSTVDVSVEIAVYEMAYDASEKVLRIKNFKFLGVTLLGSDVKPGMAGSKAYTDYSNQEHKYDQDMVNIMSKLTEALNAFNQNIEKQKQEGGIHRLTKIEKLLQKYNKIMDDITFEYNNLSDAELEEKFAELFEQTSDNSSNGTGASTISTENQTETKKAKKKCSVDESGNMTVEFDGRSFELSHGDIRNALYTLLQSCEADNEYFVIREVYDSYFVMQDWFSDKLYKQKYAKSGDEVQLDGDKERVYELYVTADEKASLEEMRSNYSDLKKFKEDFESEKKEAIFNDFESDLSEVAEFKTLKENCTKYSVSELEEKCNALLGKQYRKNSQFSNNSKGISTHSVPFNYNIKPIKKPYGDLLD